MSSINEVENWCSYLLFFYIFLNHRRLLLAAQSILNNTQKMKLNIKYTINGAILILFLSVNSCSFKEKKKPTLEDNYEQVLAEKIKISESDNGNLKVKNQGFFFGNDSLIKIPLKNFVSKKKIFFCFSKNTCTPCVEKTIEILKNIFPDYKLNERIVFISPDYEKRFRNNCYGKKLLTLEYSKFGIPIEDTEAPFFLILNNQLVIESIHIVNNLNFLKTEMYLQKIAQRVDFR